MKCYYEELGVNRDASESDIKSAYRKLALKWHPDKNPDSTEAAKERFQLIQQAYEVLSDSQERTWYDNHREQILRGKNSDYEDNCLDVFQYFTISCFKGFGDDEKGFYAIYRDVFEKISAEDVEFMDSDEQFLNIPKFGDSKSDYEEVVGPFYAHWSAYCTKRTYTWLYPYDIRDIKDRKILREIEKDMRKVVQKAKKERNEEVRNLVAYVRKRDKRVQAYKRLLDERSAFNRQKQEQNRIEQIRRRQQELEEIARNSQSAGAINNDYEEQLKQLEELYSSSDEYYDNEDVTEHENPENYNYIDELYCVACNKQFKTGKAFENHEISRKHRDNVERVKIEVQNDENLHQDRENLLEAEDIQILVSEEANDQTSIGKVRRIKTKLKKNIHQPNQFTLNDENAEEITQKLDALKNIANDDDSWDTTGKKPRKTRNKNKGSKNKSDVFEQQPSQTKIDSGSVYKNESEISTILKSEITQHICATCKSNFESKNKLFSHLKLTNHGVFIPKPKSKDDVKPKKTKGRK